MKKTMAANIGMSALDVYWHEKHVGKITRRGSGRVRFAYAESWLNANGPQISISMPCQRGQFNADISSNFFENFMPEGTIKKELAQNRRLAAHDLFDFLSEFGRDMAGALTIADENAEPPPPPGYEDITDALAHHLAKRNFKEPINLFLLLDANLSLAGGQDKLPVRYTAGRFELPRGNAPTTHIIKPVHSLFHDLPFNEHFCMTLATRAGLEAAKTEIVYLEGQPVYMVERFDRVIRDGNVIRLHQEDFCQATSIPAAGKYQAKGGPGFAEMFNVLQNNMFNNRSRDTDALIKAAIFNVIVGNTDAHGKNFSVIHHGGNLSLAPLYDLCSVYPYEDLIPGHHKLAMSIGDTYRVDHLKIKDWQKFAEVFQIDDGSLAEAMSGVSDLVIGHADRVLEEYRELYARTGIPAVIAARAVERACLLKKIADQL
jgi:serine/threonine-protein kinase HipA